MRPLGACQGRGRRPGDVERATPGHLSWTFAEICAMWIYGSASTEVTDVSKAEMTRMSNACQKVTVRAM
ncbi:hypothetical protein P4O66_003785 [Electrophorus voltai]|uniref:Uncharacterized protein n=1 Tax=Electrophorus voltai TaxID=2609070 RepID=A0AAD8ZQZ6_9TELE|nr:hypothetical protein P4O66_003785 [Electrophorus voltai]